MKRSSLYTSTAFALLLFLFSCSKKDLPAPAPPVQSASSSALKETEPEKQVSVLGKWKPVNAHAKAFYPCNEAVFEFKKNDVYGIICSQTTSLGHYAYVKDKLDKKHLIISNIGSSESIRYDITELSEQTLRFVSAYTGLVYEFSR